MFIDTSVVIAILAGENDAAYWSGRIEEAPTRVSSALVMLESARRLSTKLDIEPKVVEAAIAAFFEEAQIDIAPIGAAEGRLAIEAFSEYGKGRGNPAQLNLADCLSYACAKTRGIQFLYKGNDFSHTDLA